MANLTIQNQIAVRAAQLADFVLNPLPGDCSIQEQLRSEIYAPARFRIQDRILEINELITKHLQSSPLRQVEAIQWRTIKDRLSESTQYLSMVPLAGLAQTLNAVRQLAEFRFASPAPLPVPGPTLAEEEDPPIGIEVWEASNEVEIVRMQRDLDLEIFSSHSEELREMEEIIRLLKNGEPWKDMIEDADPQLYELFPALLAARNIQKQNLSYEDYIAEIGEPISLSKEDYDSILHRSFESFAEAMHQAMQEESTPFLLVYLKSVGYRDMKLNQRMVSLALERADDLALLRTQTNQLEDLSPSDFMSAFTTALKRDFSPFIEQAIPRAAAHASDADLAQIIALLASKGRTDDLITLFSSLRVIPYSSFFEPLRQAHLNGEDEVYELLTTNYPFDERDATDQLFSFFLSVPIEKGVEELLSGNMKRSVSAAEINRAFSQLCDSKNYPLMAHFFKTNGLTEESISLLFSTLLDEEDPHPYFQIFAGSPYFERYRFNGLYNVCIESARKGNTSLILCILDSSRGREITQELFDRLILEAGMSENWHTVLDLMEYPQRQNISKSVLHELFQRAVAHSQNELFKKIMVKNPPLYQIDPHLLNLSLFMLLSDGEIDLAKRISVHLKPEHINWVLFRDHFLGAASRGNVKSLEFLLGRYSTFCSIDLLHLGYEAARGAGQLDADHFLWVKIRDYYTIHPQTESKKRRTHAR